MGTFYNRKDSVFTFCSGLGCDYCIVEPPDPNWESGETLQYLHQCNGSEVLQHVEIKRTVPDVPEGLFSHMGAP